MQHVDIAIVGGGIVGLTLATALKDSELNIAIIDKSKFCLSTYRTCKGNPRESAK